MIAVAIARLIPVASVLICLVLGDIQSSLLMLLVCLGTTLCWLLRPTRAFEVVFNLVMLLAAWSSVWGLYEKWGGWDLLIHFLATAMLTVVTRLCIQRWWFKCNPEADGTWFTIVVGLGLCLVWEALELAGYFLVDRGIEVGALDTVGDVLAGMAGAIIVAYWKWPWPTPGKSLSTNQGQ